MPTFSRISRDRLGTCHEDLITLFNYVIERYDCSILCGHRCESSQTAAYESGNSTVQWPDSKHNSWPSGGIDVIPYNKGVDWKDLTAIAYFAGKVMAMADRMFIDGRMRYQLRWGGDWDGDGKNSDQTFNDLVHFELIFGDDSDRSIDRPDNGTGREVHPRQDRSGKSSPRNRNPR